MKILLISIDLILGTRILVSLLKNNGFRAQNLQITGVKYSDTFSEKALEDIYEFSKGYDAVGLSFNSFYSLLASRLGGYLKSRGVKYLIAGGPHVTAKPEETLSYADISVIYEAEITLPKVLEHLKKGLPLGEISGIAFKDEKGKTIKTGAPEIVQDISKIPFQSISPEEITYYDTRDNAFSKPALLDLFPHGGKNYFIIGSRGCPFNCTYCSNSLFAKLNRSFVKVRRRSPENLIEEMEKGKDAGFKGFYIADDNFFAFTLDDIKVFAGLYKSRINLPFGVGGINPNNMKAKDSSRKLDILLEAGLSDVRIGVQSGSDKTLKILKRNYTAGELPRLLRHFENRKTIWGKPGDRLRVAVDIICDSPWEDEKDKLETLKMANGLLSRYGVFFYTLVYLPGTEIYDLARREGWIKDEESDIYLKGIAGVEDNVYNRLLFLIAVLKERRSRIPEEIITHILKADRENPALSKGIIDSVIKTVNDVEEHHSFDGGHLTIHPYLKGFNAWEKTVGRKGKKVLFRSYHEPYG